MRPLTGNRPKSNFLSGLPLSVLHPMRRVKRAGYAWLNRSRFQAHLRPTDVFLVGHPKSGNTWLALMLGVLLEKRREGKITLANVKDFIPAFHADDASIRDFDHLSDPRIFRNEGPVYPDLYPKTLCIIRDPRAVYVSYYRHLCHDQVVLQGRASPWSMEQFVDEILTHGCLRNHEPYLVRWDRQVRDWLARAKSQPVLIVRYEDMKQDRRAVLEKAAEFIGLDCEAGDIDRAVERGSFDSMREEEKTHGAEPYSGTRGEGGFFVRKGSVDGWKKEMPTAIEEKILDQFSATMEAVGYL